MLKKMSAKHKNITKSNLCGRRSYALLVLLVLTSTLCCCMASPDYADTGDNNNSAEVAANNEEVYDSALQQQDLETDEHRQKSSEEEEQTEMSLDDMMMMAFNETAFNDTVSREVYSSLEQAENVSFEERNSLSHNHEEDYDEQTVANAVPSAITHSASAAVSSITSEKPTLISDYVRKAKAEGFKTHLPDKANDYMNHMEEAKEVKAKDIRDIMDTPKPFELRYQQTDDSQEHNQSSIESNHLQANNHHEPIYMSQQQQPDYAYQHQSGENEEDEYYVDSLEQQQQKHASTEGPLIISTLSSSSSTAASSTITTESIQLPAIISTEAPLLPAAAVAETTTSRTPSIGKQGKQINITRRKLLPHEQLRNYIEDAYIRMPLAVIVDPSADSLEKTKTLWGDALRMNLNVKIVLVSLNAAGIPAAYNFNNTRQFMAGLNSIKEHDGGNAFIGILHASELVPYDSAVFISTATIPPHTELVQDAAITLLKKRIRLYLIWYGEKAISENETQEAVGGILGEVAIRSGGEVLHIVGNDTSQELEGSTLTLVADAFRGSQEIEIPVDTTLSSLHVKIDSPMRTATLETPNGG